MVGIIDGVQKPFAVYGQGRSAVIVERIADRILGRPPPRGAIEGSDPYLESLIVRIDPAHVGLAVHGDDLIGGRVRSGGATTGRRKQEA